MTSVRCVVWSDREYLNSVRQRLSLTERASHCAGETVSERMTSQTDECRKAPLVHDAHTVVHPVVSGARAPPPNDAWLKKKSTSPQKPLGCPLHPTQAMQCGESKSSSPFQRMFVSLGIFHPGAFGPGRSKRSNAVWDEWHAKAHDGVSFFETVHKIRRVHQKRGAATSAGDVKVHPRCKTHTNSYSTKGFEKSLYDFTGTFLQWVNSLLPQ